MSDLERESERESQTTRERQRVRDREMLPLSLSPTLPFTRCFSLSHPPSLPPSPPPSLPPSLSLSLSRCLGRAASAPSLTHAAPSLTKESTHSSEYPPITIRHRGRICLCERRGLYLRYKGSSLKRAFSIHSRMTPLPSRACKTKQSHLLAHLWRQALMLRDSALFRLA